MPAGLKATSANIAIGFSVPESAPNTFTQGSTDLNLSPLDREVFVVLAVNLDASFPDIVAPLATNVRAGLTTTSQTSVPNLSDSNCLARITEAIEHDGIAAVSFSTSAGETPPATLEYIGIIATNDFFIQVQGTNNVTSKGVSGKLYGYRARVTDAGIYAALVQSEVLSA